MKMYDYLVSFRFSAEGYLTPGYGTVQVSRKKKIKMFEDVNELNKYITDQNNEFSNVSIYNIILLGRNKH